MKIRWKFFIILLTFSFTPLVVVTLISQGGTDRMGRALSENARQNFTQMVYQELELAAKNHASTLIRGKKAAEYSLLVLTRAAEQDLASGKSREPDQEIFDPSVSDDPGSAADKGLFPTSYGKILPDGREVPLPINWRQPVYHLAPGLARGDIREDLAGISTLVPRLKEILAGFGAYIHWAHIGLENGLLVSYPGHDGYPLEHDPRKTQWYLRAVKNSGHAGRAIWSYPLRDPATGQWAFTASKAFFYPDGSLAGVAAMDMLVSRILQESELANLWSEEMKSFLVEKRSNSETGQPGLRILATSNPAGMNQPVFDSGMQWLRSPDSKKLQKILASLARGRSGCLELKYRDQSAVWAYANLEENLHMVVIVPKSVIMSLPDKTSRLVVTHANKMLLLIGLTALVLLAVLVAASFFGSRATTEIFLRIASAAQRLSEGDLTARVSLRTGDERDLVIRAFNEMGPKLEDHLRIRRALNLAQEVQQSLLPKREPRVPGLDISGISVYCDETGGDYYDFFHFRSETQNTLSVIIGDVSGHGISSALLMATARALFRQRLSMPGDPERIISDVNSLLAQDTITTGHFMTLFYCEIDMSQEKVRWVRAGHEAALIYDRFADRFEELDGDGMALGVLEEFSFEQYCRSLKPGQIIVIGTDGIWETANAQGEMFGMERFKQIIREHSGQSARRMESAVVKRLEDFLGDQKPTDDVTLVIIKIQQSSNTNSR